MVEGSSDDDGIIVEAGVARAVLGKSDMGESETADDTVDVDESGRVE